MELLDLREHKTIVSAFRRLEDDERLGIDTTLLDELQNYTAYARTMRDISAGRYKTREDLHGLARPYEEVQFFRGRVLRIRTGHLPVLRILKRIWAVCTTALYESAEISKLSPVARKDAAIVTVLEPLRERIDDCEVVIETAGEVEKLLANAYFTLKELRGINEAFLDEHRRERGV